MSVTTTHFTAINVFCNQFNVKPLNRSCEEVQGH